MVYGYCFPVATLYGEKMTDEYEIIMSPLCQEVSSDGETVQVEIYRGEDDKGWILEVVDEYGNSSVWDDQFKTDNDAFKEALKTIEEEGISLLIGSQADETIATADELPIDKKLRELDDFLCSDTVPDTAMDVSTLEGFLTALVIGPDIIPPSQYMPWIWDMDNGENEIIYDSMEQMNDTMNLVMQVWNNIAEIYSNSPSSFEPAYFRAIEWGAAEWCEGFLLGTQLSSEAWAMLWIAQPKLVTPFLRLGDETGIEITKKEKDAEKWMDAVPEALEGIHAFWLERRKDSNGNPTMDALPVTRAPKVGRNEPCPCGSGKKFKKCCGAPPTIH
jgi:uncharacterized protein